MREAAACFADRLRDAVRTHQSVRELTMSAPSALSDHDPTHAQFFQSHTHPIDKAPCNVVDGDGLSALKRPENNLVNRQAQLSQPVRREVRQKPFPQNGPNPRKMEAQGMLKKLPEN
jgi:hypothetical protein